MPKIFEYFGFIFYFFSKFINKYWQRIVEKWIDFFVMKKVVKTTYIKEKL